MPDQNAVVRLVHDDAPAIEHRAHALIWQAGRAEIIDDDTYSKGGDLLKLIRSERQKAEDARKFLVKPLNDHVKAINAEWKRVTGPLEEAEKSLREKMSAYARELENKRKADEEQRRKELEVQALDAAEQAQQAGNTEAANQYLEEASRDVPSRSEGPVRGKYGSATSVRKTWKFRLTDINQVPREYLILDEKAVREAIRNGVRDIPGIEVYEDVGVQVR